MIMEFEFELFYMLDLLYLLLIADIIAIINSMDLRF